MRLFAILLLFFPRSFRDRFGAGMRFAFAEEIETARSRGWRSVVGLWIRTLASVPLHGIAERLGETGRRSGVPAGYRGGIGPSGWGGDRGGVMDTISRELRQAVRRLVGRPVFALTALATLGIGIGGATAIFSVIEGVILRPLPYDHGHRLVTIGHESSTDVLGMPDAAYLHYSERARTIESIGVWMEISSPIAGLGEPMELDIIRASRTLLPTLGVEPVLGRGFVADDHEPGAVPVVLVSHDFWTNRLGADPAALGRPLLPGSTGTVVGVLPEGFEFLRPEALVVFGNRFDAPDVIEPLQAFDATSATFGNFIYHGLGRLTDGATVEEARRELDALMREASGSYGGITPERLEERRFRPRVVALVDDLVEDVAGVLWILMGAVGFVLLIALANVANLFLVRAEARTGEVAVRRALGASRMSVALAFGCESALLAVGGGLLGLAFARFGTTALIALVPGSVPRLDLVGINAMVLTFALGLSTVAGVLLGVVPTLQDDGDVADRLREDGRGGGASKHRARVRGALVTSQIALSLVLLVGSALLFTSFRNLRDVDPGFEVENVLTLRLPLSGSILSAAGYVGGPADRRRSDFMRDIVDRLEGIPGVERASFSADLPLDGDEWHDAVAIEGAWPTGPDGGFTTQRVFMGPGYLAAIGASMARGREFERQDFVDQPRVVVVNEAFAELHWPDSDPLGRRLAQHYAEVDPDGDIYYTVVGVVEDVREVSLMESPEPTVYLPTIFLPEGDFFMWVSNLVALVRTSGDPTTLLPRVREEVLAYRPDVPINNVATLEEIASRSFGEVGFSMLLVAIAATISLLLGMVGIYGTVSYVVARRTREFGLRMALGASGGDVSRSVLRRGGMVGVKGVVLGLVGSLAGARLLESLLFGVSAADPWIYLGVATLLFGVVLVASLVPARRAARTDPLVAMRAE